MIIDITNKHIPISNEIQPLTNANQVISHK